MIEVNTKAKPYNRVESLIGTELFFALRRCSVFGRNYYDPSRETSTIDILGQLKTNVGFSSVLKMLKNLGWEDKLVNEGLPHLYQFRKAEADKTLHLFLAIKPYHYDDIMRAQEVCKYLQSLQVVEQSLDKLMVTELHQLMMDGVSVKLNPDFTFSHLFLPPADAPEPGGWGGGLGGGFGAHPVAGGAAAWAGINAAPHPAADLDLDMQQLIAAMHPNNGGNNNNA